MQACCIVVRLYSLDGAYTFQNFSVCKIFVRLYDVHLYLENSTSCPMPVTYLLHVLVFDNIENTVVAEFVEGFRSGGHMV